MRDSGRESKDDDRAAVARFEALATQVRGRPEKFANTAALARAADVDRAGLGSLLREHAHREPSAWLELERTRAACRKLHGKRARPGDAAHAAGFAGRAAFERACRKHMRMPPEAYRALGSAPRFSVALPARYRAADILAYHARDPLSSCERVRGNCIYKALLGPDGPAVLEISIAARRADCRVHARAKLGGASVRCMHAVALGMLGLSADVVAFEMHAGRDARLAALVAKRRGLRVPLSATVFDGLCWAIVGQQINVAFAASLRRDLIELAGQKIDGMRAHPTPAQVAALDMSDLRQRRFSRSKAEYLTGAAQAILQGQLAIDSMSQGSAVAAEQSLTAVRGIGTWTARYLLMRGLGFADCAPIGDVALAAALKTFTAAAERPGHDEVEALMRPFSPHRSLATCHLWASLRD